MKKHIASPKWLITYFVVLLFLACFTAIGIALIMYSVSTNSTEALAVGIVVLVYMLPITGIVLFYLNRRACRIWVADGCFKWKGLLFGFSGSITPEEIDSVGSGTRTIYISAMHSKSRMHCRKGIFELSNNPANRTLLKTFYSGEIYPPELCDTCKNVEVGKFNTPEKYLDALSHLEELIANENYESSYSVDAVQHENGCWADIILRDIKCKKCGARIYFYADAYYGKGNLSVIKHVEYTNSITTAKENA